MITTNNELMCFLTFAVAFLIILDIIYRVVRERPLRMLFCTSYIILCAVYMVISFICTYKNY